MKKQITIILILCSFGAIAQSQLKYSGFFDSYYRTGPLKYFVEPGMTFMQGELGKNQYSAGIGGGVNYRILPPLYLNGSIRYMNMHATDHDSKRTLSFGGNYLQFNAIGNYHFLYDRVRTSIDRRKGPKKFNAYVSLGLSFMLYSSATGSNSGGSDTYGTVISREVVNITQIFSKFSQVVQFPIGLGLPIRVTPRFTVTPEIMGYFGFSDKLDGLVYSKTNYKDAYTFANVKLMFNPKGKRRKPKPVYYSGHTSESGGGGGFDDMDSDDDGFDNFDGGADEEIDMSPSQPIIDEPEETEETNDEETEDEEIIEDTEEDDGFLEEEGEEGDGPKYDEDGFLIDDE